MEETFFRFAFLVLGFSFSFCVFVVQSEQYILAASPPHPPSIPPSPRTPSPVSSPFPPLPTPAPPPDATPPPPSTPPSSPALTNSSPPLSTPPPLQPFHRTGKPSPHPHHPNRPRTEKNNNTSTARHGHFNIGKKTGLLFVGIAGILQIFVVGFLVVKRQQLLKVKDRYENVH